MMEMGGSEALPSEVELSMVSADAPSPHCSEKKRRREMLNEEICTLPSKGRAVASQGHMCSSRNALFDDPISPEFRSHTSDALFHAPIRSSGYLGASASSSSGGECQG